MGATDICLAEPAAAAVNGILIKRSRVIAASVFFLSTFFSTEVASSIAGKIRIVTPESFHPCIVASGTQAPFILQTYGYKRHVRTTTPLHCNLIFDTAPKKKKHGNAFSFQTIAVAPQNHLNFLPAA
jgi:hypothetical protein